MVDIGSWSDEDGDSVEEVEAGPASDAIEQYYHEKLDKRGKKPQAPAGGDAGEGAEATALAFSVFTQQFVLN
jgi:hypothetical protein